MDRPRSVARPHRASTRRPALRLALGMAVILVALGYLAYQGLSNNLVYYITPSELLTRSPADQTGQLRLGGQVRPGSQHWNAQLHRLRFILQDPGHGITVISSVLPPPLFRSGIGAVVEGVYRHGRFYASSVLVKHSSTYVAPRPGHLPKSDQYVRR